MNFLLYVLMEAKWIREDSTMVVSIVWALWINRNEVRHGGSRKNGKQLIQWCTHYLKEYWVVLVVLLKFSQPLELKWLLPLAPSYKTNVDGAIFSNKKEARVVVIIQDHAGNFIIGLSKKLQFPMGAIEVDAKLLKLILCLQRKWASRTLCWKVTL